MERWRKEGDSRAGFGLRQSRLRGLRVSRVSTLSRESLDGCLARGAKDAQVYANDRAKLPEALGHDVSYESAHTPAIKRSKPSHHHNQRSRPSSNTAWAWGMASNLPAPDNG